MSFYPLTVSVLKNDLRPFDYLVKSFASKSLRSRIKFMRFQPSYTLFAAILFATATGATGLTSLNIPPISSQSMNTNMVMSDLSVVGNLTY